MRLSEKIRGGREFSYDEESFLIVLESNLHLIKQMDHSTPYEVPPLDALKFQGDLHGYLFSINVPFNLHWITMRASGLDSANAFNRETKVLLIPTVEYIQTLMTIHQTVYSV